MSFFKRIALVWIVLLWPAAIFGNEIYITQIGDTLDLDITQDGQNNQIGDASGDAEFEGDDMTFAITQTGNLNTIVADINGNTYTGTWTITGNSNAIDLVCDTAGNNCETVTLNITGVGDDQSFDIDIGGTNYSQNTTI